jgi:hypothetical protein
MSALVFKQVVSFLIRHESWSDAAKREHVLSTYSGMGATEEVYQKAKEWVKTHK